MEPAQDSRGFLSRGGGASVKTIYIHILRLSWQIVHTVYPSPFSQELLHGRASPDAKIQAKHRKAPHPLIFVPPRRIAASTELDDAKST